MTQEQKKEYIDGCISCGKAVKPEGFTLSRRIMQEIEITVNTFNDYRARKIINKLLE